mmetsp:Transcript_1024/g.2454  ORF Transcript_1024/g.2454 Transcript_1024/m.2454 type:complete len:592 (+) Transcript_1024:58-1833(+)
MGNKMHVQILLWSFVLVVLSPSPSTSFLSSEGTFSSDSSSSRLTSFIPATQIQSAKKKSRRKRKNICAFSSRKSFRQNELSQSSAPALIAFYSVGGGGGGGDGGDGDGSLEGQMSSSGNDIKSESNQHSALGISVSLFVTYLTVMGAKCALPSTLSFLTSPNSGLSHPSSSTVSRHDVLSRLLALSTLSIATGKLALGPMIDSLGGVASLQIALSTLALCLGLIGFGNQTCPTLKILSIYWIIVDFAFSTCWAACVKSIREYTNEKKWAKEIGRLAVAARSGNAISFAFFAWLLQWAPRIDHNGVAEIDSSWRWVFRASSAIQLIPLAMLSYFGKTDSKTYSSRGLDKVLAESSQSTEQGSKMKKSLTILRNQSQTLEFWLHLISRSITMVLVSFLLFIPTFMKQCFEMSSASSARVGSFFAVGCLSSVSVFADKAYPSSQDSAVSKSIHKHKAYSMLALLTISTVTLALQSSFLRNTISISSNVGTLLMFLWGFSLAIPFYLPSSMFALKRGGIEGSATIVDAFDAVGFVLLATFNGYVARIVGVSGMNGLLRSRKRAWLPVFQLMMTGSMIASLTLFLAVFSEGWSDRY